MKQLVWLLAVAACSDSSGPGLLTINPHNRSQSEVRVVVTAVAAPSDTLYDTTFPAGAHSCGILESRRVRITLIPSGAAGDTTLIIPDRTVRRILRVDILSGLRATLLEVGGAC